MISVRILKSFYVAVVVFECLLALGANATGKGNVYFMKILSRVWTQSVSLCLTRDFRACVSKVIRHDFRCFFWPKKRSCMKTFAFESFEPFAGVNYYQSVVSNCWIQMHFALNRQIYSAVDSGCSFWNLFNLRTGADFQLSTEYKGVRNFFTKSALKSNYSKWYDRHWILLPVGQIIKFIEFVHLVSWRQITMCRWWNNTELKKTQKEILMNKLNVVTQYYYPIPYLIQKILAGTTRRYQ